VMTAVFPSSSRFMLHLRRITLTRFVDALSA
jgi:hypothetical protein